MDVKGHNGEPPPARRRVVCRSQRRAHVSARKASSVVPSAPFGSAVPNDWMSGEPTESLVSR